jgi:hypothetical protein
VTATAKKASQETSPNTTLCLLPWPIPPEGASVEVARWLHGPTTKRNAWHVVYQIKILCEAEEARFIYHLRADSLEQDQITEEIRQRYFCHDEKFVEAPSLDQRQAAPVDLVSAWEQVVANVTAIAAKQKQRYDAAAEEW